MTPRVSSRVSPLLRQPSDLTRKMMEENVYILLWLYFARLQSVFSTLLMDIINIIRSGKLGMFA